MAFNWLKKAATSVVKTVTPVVKLASPIYKPIYDMAVPEPVKKVVRIVKRIAPVAKILNRRKGINMNMNELELKLRGLLEQALDLKNKSGMDLALASGFMLQNLVGLVNLVKSMPQPELMAGLEKAIDGMVGDEATALIGPTGQLVQLDVPYVDDEQLYDLILGSVRTAVQDMKPAEAATDSPG